MNGGNIIELLSYINGVEVLPTYWRRLLRADKADVLISKRELFYSRGISRGFRRGIYAIEGLVFSRPTYVCRYYDFIVYIMVGYALLL